MSDDVWDFKSARDELLAFGMRLTRRNGKYLVNFNRGGVESTAYYTDDVDDAVATGIAMARIGNAVAGTTYEIPGMTTDEFMSEFRSLDVKLRIESLPFHMREGVEPFALRDGDGANPGRCPMEIMADTGPCDHYNAARILNLSRESRQLIQFAADHSMRECVNSGVSAHVELRAMFESKMEAAK